MEPMMMMMPLGCWECGVPTTDVCVVCKRRMCPNHSMRVVVGAGVEDFLDVLEADVCTKCAEAGV